MSTEENPWTTGGDSPGNPWVPSDAGGWTSPDTTSTPLPARRVSDARTQAADDNAADFGAWGAYLFGNSDSILLSWGEEMDAWERSVTPTWLGGSGKSYAENLRENRAILKRSQEEHGDAFLAGQITGAFVPVTGWGSRAEAAGQVVKAGRVAELRKLVMAGAAQGAVYGAGSSEAEDFYGTVRDAAVGSVLGAAGGYVLGTTIIPAGRWGLEKAAALIGMGRTPKLNFEFKPGSLAHAAEDVAEDIGAARVSFSKRPSAPREATSAPRTNPLTGLADNVVEEGAVFSAREVAEGTTAVRNTILDRISALSPSEAKIAAQKLDKAMASGDLASDPHFRSILGLDLDGVTDDVGAALKGAVVFEDMTQALLERAGMGAKTVKGMEADLRSRLGGEIGEGDIDRLVSAQIEANGAANIGRTVMALAGVQFSKATKELLPLVMKGEADARSALAEELTRAIRISAKGRFLVSSAGRNLGQLSHASSMPFAEVAGDAVEIESAKAIQARVNAALEKLDDNELNELLSRIGDLSDLERVQQVLLNADMAEAVAGYRKAFNSIGLWIKSNSLTPMSGIVNTVGFVMHDLFRNGWARDFAAMVARNAGRVEEAQILLFQREVTKAVYWQAHGAGIKAAFGRLKWEWWTSVERIAGVAGAERAALKASTSRQALIAGGYRPPELREFDQMATLGVSNLRGFNQRLADRAQDGGGFATLVNALERTYATTINTVDALGTASARVVSGVLDDWGRNFVKVKEVYAQSAGFAVREAIDAGLDEKQMAEYVGRRTAELAEMPPAEILGEVERKLVGGEDLADVDRMLLRRDYDAEREAEAVLFMDGPQTSGGRIAAQAAAKLDQVASLGTVPGILMTYIRTPTRIFERGLASYTPWAGKIAETQAILARGGVEAAVERARMDLGGMIMGIGMMAAASGVITVTNGGFKNSANLTGAPANRLNLPGGGYVELSRLDPFALTVALGGIIGQAWKSAADDVEPYGRDEALGAAMATAWAAVKDGILEKTYMTSARDLIKAATADDGGTAGQLWGDMVAGALVRAIPLSGTSSQINATIAGNATEAAGWMDKLFRVIPGMGAYLPARVDALGNDVEGRTMGLAAGTTADADDLTSRVAALGIDISNLRKADPTGFDLTSEELSELRRIRATEATNANGLTMRDALEELLDDPSFQALPSREQKHAEVVDLMAEFNEPARALFEERNQQYLADREANRSLKEYIAEGIARSEAARMAQEDTTAQGLPVPSRLPQ